jgi:hypothetical protein
MLFFEKDGYEHIRGAILPEGSFAGQSRWFSPHSRLIVNARLPRVSRPCSISRAETASLTVAAQNEGLNYRQRLPGRALELPALSRKFDVFEEPIFVQAWQRSRRPKGT